MGVDVGFGDDSVICRAGCVARRPAPPRLGESGGYDRHLRAARKRYRTRRDALLAAPGRRLPAYPIAGLAVVVFVWWGW